MYEIEDFFLGEIENFGSKVGYKRYSQRLVTSGVTMEGED